MSDPFDAVSRPGLPDRDQLLEFIKNAAGPVKRKELADAFGLRADERQELRSLLKALVAQGVIEIDRAKHYRLASGLPSVMVLVVTGPDLDGEWQAQPVEILEGKTIPPIYLHMGRAMEQPTIGDKILARLELLEDGCYRARVIRKLDQRVQQKLLGQVEKERDQFRLRPVDKRARHDFDIPAAHLNGALSGELVLAEMLAAPTNRSRHHDARRAVRVVERLGDLNAPRAISLIAIHTHELPVDFSIAALEQARAAKPAPLGNRVDRRDVPLVTIDGPDARDFDDAVFAESDGAGGWHLIVAIADVAHYVPPGSPLDEDAVERGNSVYFPDRVVPMLPEELSNDLCSLRPNEDRASMICHLWIDSGGQLTKHQFERGLIQSRARLTYEQVQLAHDGQPDAMTAPLIDGIITPLYRAFDALLRARHRRGTLELDLPERQIIFNELGKVGSIVPRARLNSHRLIEEFMIAANVAAATELEKARLPTLYRIHDQPDAQKLANLGDYLRELGYKLPKGPALKPAALTQVLEQSRELAEAPLISEMVLRSQAQARYSPDNIGHFGLSLQRYAHFTSPIRRYADLVVHRGLIRVLGLGNDGLTTPEIQQIDKIGQQVSDTERRAIKAERDAIGRYTAAYLSDRVGAEFVGRISGVTRAGLFVTLAETGADGIVPMASLPDDFYLHDEKRHALVGRRHGRTFRLCQTVTVRLREADPVSGSLVFQIIGEGEKSPRPARTTTPEKPTDNKPKRKPFKKTGRDKRKRSS
jgi:ribonuclease R